jgi:hypothetical protein
MNEKLPLESGLSRSRHSCFLVDEDALRRIEATLAKAAPDLGVPTQVVFHVEREDDRFYETTKLEDVLSDPNLPGRRIFSVSVELRKETQDRQRPWEPDWVARVSLIKEHRHEDIPFDTDEVQIRISTPDRSWALMLADQLEPQVERLFVKRRFTMALIYLIGLFVTSLLVITGESLEKHRPPLALIQEPYTLWKLGATSAGVLILLTVLSHRPFRFLVPKWLREFGGYESIFLWGEEAKLYPGRQATRRSLFWGIVVAFFVSATAGVAVSWIWSLP